MGDNIDTDQIIPAEYLTLVPTIGRNTRNSAVCVDRPADDRYPVKFFPTGEKCSPFEIVVAGRNFWLRQFSRARTHRPGRGGECARWWRRPMRIFFRNSVATGELYPFESVEALNEILHTGDEVTLDFEQGTLTHEGKIYSLKPLGEVRPVVEAGGLFNYARKTGMIAARA